MGSSSKRALVPIGLIFSVSGSYRTVGREMLNGALLALEEVNESPDFDFRFAPVTKDPGGDTTRYRLLADELLSDHNVRHLVGCYTSSSRKELIPTVEKYDALLWYPSHYEGFETCNNVIYTGASPNQHIVPLSAYMLRHYGGRVYCVGSNYIWAWENNRILREIVQGSGGAILAEKYLPVGSTEVEHFIRDIKHMRPDFVFNTLIGESSYAFYRAYYDAGRGHTEIGPARIPVTSCSLSEPELLSIGGEAAAGHIASSVYFQSIEGARNERFVQRYRARFGAGAVTSADAEASYIAVILLAMAIRRAGTCRIEPVKQALYDCRLEAPQGPAWICAENNHSYLTPSLARSRADGQFEIFYTAGEPVRPDPYLVWLDLASVGTPSGKDRRPGGPSSHLQVVSE